MQNWEVLTCKIGGEEYAHSLIDLSSSRTDFFQMTFLKICGIEGAYLYDKIITNKKLY
jgi:hypothetical protein